MAFFVNLFTLGIHGCALRVISPLVGDPTGVHAVIAWLQTGYDQRAIGGDGITVLELLDWGAALKPFNVWSGTSLRFAGYHQEWVERLYQFAREVVGYPGRIFSKKVHKKNCINQSKGQVSLKIAIKTKNQLQVNQNVFGRDTVIMYYIHNVCISQWPELSHNDQILISMSHLQWEQLIELAHFWEKNVHVYLPNFGKFVLTYISSGHMVFKAIAQGLSYNNTV